MDGEYYGWFGANLVIRAESQRTISNDACYLPKYSKAEVLFVHLC